MVHPAHQRRGRGRRLLTRIVDGRTPAVLVTHPDAPARVLYERTGWRHTGDLGPPAAPTWVLYLHP